MAVLITGLIGKFLFQTDDFLFTRSWIDRFEKRIVDRTVGTACAYQEVALESIVDDIMIILTPDVPRCLLEQGNVSMF